MSETPEIAECKGLAKQVGIGIALARLHVGNVGEMRDFSARGDVIGLPLVRGSRVFLACAHGVANDAPTFIPPHARSHRCDAVRVQLWARPVLWAVSDDLV